MAVGKVIWKFLGKSIWMSSPDSQKEENTWFFSGQKSLLLFMKIHRDIYYGL